MMCLVDELLPQAFVRKLVQSYIQDERIIPDFNMFVASLEVSKEVIKKMPSVRILIGTEDTFYTSQWRYMQMLKEAGVDSKIYVYKGLRHGILT